MDHTHNEDWVMVDIGAGVSACPVDYAPTCVVKPGSVKLLLLVPHGAHRPEDGWARHMRWCQSKECVRSREGATTTAHGGQLGGERTGGSVHGSWWFIIPRSAMHVHRIHTRSVHHEQYSLLTSTDHICASGSRGLGLRIAASSLCA